MDAPAFDKYNLPDISSCALPKDDEKAKIRYFLDFVKNPYLFRVGDIGVHVVFSGEPGDSLQSHIYHLLSSKL